MSNKTKPVKKPIKQNSDDNGQPPLPPVKG